MFVAKIDGGDGAAALTVFAEEEEIAQCPYMAALKTTERSRRP
jgi:hypothetical protein